MTRQRHTGGDISRSIRKRGTDMLTRTPVQSSNIAEIGYDEQTETLDVLFHNGRVYRYVQVSKPEYDALMGAESIGKHFQAFIRPKQAARIA